MPDYKLFYSIVAKLCLICILGVIVCYSGSAQSNKENLKLWFDKPAADWNNALPVGNGRLGAMVFGNIEQERIQLNEESVWTGSKSDFTNPLAKKGLKEVRELLFEGKYAEAEKVAQEKLMGDKKIPSSYQSLGDLQLTFPKSTSISNYRRELDLESAISSVSYTADGINYKRETFSSAPDQVIAIKLTSDKPSNFSVALTRTGGNPMISSTKNELILSENVGNGNGVFLNSRLRIQVEEGSFKKINNTFQITNAKTVILFLAAATNYHGGSPIKITKNHIDKASAKAYDQLKKDHTSDYQKYFNRVNFSLNSIDNSSLPTDLRLSKVKDGGIDNGLIELYYQFGRYLLISSSRPGSMPANLQGIWADGMNPPWDADYHININIQMNYWPAEITNLSELHLPFLQFINELREDGRKTAKDMYGVEGAVAHFTTDAWHFTEPYGKTDWAMWPMGYAWSSTHLWEHYRFTEDTVYLRSLAYPAMRDAAQFCVNWLVQNPKLGKLVSGPSISPENKFITSDGKIASIVMGPTMDHMIIRDILTGTINASKILNTDSVFRIQMENTLNNLSPIKVGSDGRLMEWTEEFKEENPGHRHISHLYGLHPGNQITQQTPELLDAARKTIDYRLAHGGGHTGWSRAWIINFFARLGDGEAAYQNLLALLRKSTLSNLFDNHPPFQIDGNFGATAGITEMLMQSHTNEILVLPALPKEWSKGNIKGIVARGGFVINIEWENDVLKTLTVHSKLGNVCNIRYGNKTVSFNTIKETEYNLNDQLVLK